MLPDQMSSEREDGFTLIELLIAIAVSGILIVAITTGFITILRGTATAHDRLVASNGSHTLSTYFTADAESANPDLATSDGLAVMGCATDPPAASRNVIRFQWSERSTPTELRAFSVSYRILAIDTDADAVDDRWQLVRYACSDHEDPATPTTTMATILSGAALTDHVLIHELHEPTGSAVTAATINDLTRDVELVVYAAAQVRNESEPFSYKFSATMRTPEPAPSVRSIERNGAATTNASTVAWTVKFSEAVSGVDAGDFDFFDTGTVTGAAVTNVTALSGTTYTVEASTGSGQGTLALTVVDNDTILSVADSDKLGGTGLGNGNFTGGAYIVDLVAPAVEVAQSPGQADPAATPPVLFTATFSEAVTGFDASDVSYTGTTPAGATISVTGSGKDYVISFTSVPGTGSRTISPSIAAGKAVDAAGNGNAASTDGADNEVTFDPSGPAPTIASVDLWNAGTPGKIEKGDKIIVTFSEPMSVSSFCDDWSDDTQDQVLDGDNKVTVTVKNDSAAAGGDDEVVVSAGGSVCSFNFGSIDLGSAGYVATNADFKGKDGDQSTVQWSASARTLTITLGSPSKATGTVASSAPTYTIDPAIRTSAAPGTVTGSSLTLADEQQF